MSFVLKIEKFQCHSNLTVEIKAGTINLIRGPSGIGKSTILRAISWCLYSHSRGIYNKDDATKDQQCRVSITRGGLYIWRQAKPQLLVLKCQKQEYQGDVAQGIIDSVFGDRVIWRSCCYIPQKESCLFLTMPSKDRLAILNRMAFRNDPQEDLDKISAKIREAEANASNLAHSAGYARRFFVDKAEEAGNPDLDLEPIDTNVDAILSRCKELRLKVLEQQRSEGRRLEVERAMSSHRSNLDALPPTRTTGDLEAQITAEEAAFREEERQYERLVRSYDNYISRERERRPYIYILEKLNPGQKYTREDWNEASRHERRSEKSRKICAKYAIPPNEEAVMAEISALRKEKERQAHARERQRCLGLIEKLVETLPVVVEDPGDLSGLRAELVEAEACFDVLVCPECKANLRHLGGCLVPSEARPTVRKPTEIIRELAEKEKAKELFLRRKDITERIATLQAMVPHDVGPIGEDVTAKLHDLERVRHLSLPQTSSKDIEAAIFLLEHPAIDPVEAPGARPQRTNIEDIKRQLDVARKREWLGKAIAALEIEMSRLPMLDDTLDERCKEAEALAKSMEKRRRLDGVISNLKELRSRAEEEERKAKASASMVLSLRKLSELATNVACRRLEKKVAQINRGVRAILSSFFPEPIIVALVIKSKGKVPRAALGIKITYKGMDYKNISELSGGEGERISIALSLSLSQVISTPLVIFDEVWASLPSHTSAACLEACPTGPNTILCVSHQEEISAFGNVIDL